MPCASAPMRSADRPRISDAWRNMASPWPCAPRAPAAFACAMVADMPRPAMKLRISAVRCPSGMRAATACASPVRPARSRISEAA
ncbi:metal transport protein [Sphingomonas sp. BHC-A]|nr:metal transport protein [Sphingomonas sp. BHC-A]